jgi:hypothetical protein
MTSLDFTKLTRRRGDGPDCWHIYCGDIRAGTISKAVGMPNAQNDWSWSAGFYPGSHPREIKGGSAPTFDEAKAAFEPAWLAFAESRTDADFAVWRDQRDFTAWKYEMRDHGSPMPTQSESGRARCFCGAEVTTASVLAHVRTAHRDRGEQVPIP